MERSEVAVLVVGAGPVGLTVANTLVKFGVTSFRLIDRAPDVGTDSRGVNIWARTQEVLHALGVRDRIAKDAVVARARVLFAYGEPIGDAALNVAPSPFPAALTMGQAEIQGHLHDHLVQAGHPAEFGTELVELRQDESGAGATLRHADGAVEFLRCRYVVAADGGRSTVRRALGVHLEPIDIPAARIHQIDAKLSWSLTSDPGYWYMFLLPNGQGGIAPLPRGYTRVFAALRAEDALPDRDPTVEEMAELLRQFTGDPTVELSDPIWYGHGGLTSGLAPAFQFGRVLLAGDAAHKVIPVGAQGMNTGIQDAFNLGWKLAAVVQQLSPETLIDTYAEERRPIREQLAREQSESFHRIFHPTPEQIEATKEMARQVVSTNRSTDLPKRDLNGLDIAYPQSSLSTDLLGDDGLAAGQRVPDVRLVDLSRGRQMANAFDLVYSGGWSVLAFDGGSKERSAAALDAVAHLRRARPNLAGRAVFGCSEAGAVANPGDDVYLDVERRAHRAFRVTEPTLFLVRPDGHVGFRAPLDDLDVANAYLDQVLHAATAGVAASGL